MAYRHRIFKKPQGRQPNSPEDTHATTRMTVRALLTSSAFLLLLAAYTSAEDQPTCKAIWYIGTVRIYRICLHQVLCFVFVFMCKNKTENFPFSQAF